MLMPARLQQLAYHPDSGPWVERSMIGLARVLVALCLGLLVQQHHGQHLHHWRFALPHLVLALLAFGLPVR
jgi:hypothetical protein